MKFTYYGYTNQGPHPENQDAFDFLDNGTGIAVACIADGVGGASYGKEASEIAVKNFLKNAFNSNLDLTDVVVEIHNQIVLKAASLNCEGQMLTTFTGCVVENGKLTGVHSGDTRLYLLRDNGIKQLTNDQTEVARLVRSGKLSVEDSYSYPRRHILESALGVSVLPLIDHFEHEMLEGDRVLLTTDGVHEIVSKKRIRDLSLASECIEDLVKLIVKEVEDFGPNDNFTILGFSLG